MQILLVLILVAIFVASCQEGIQQSNDLDNLIRRKGTNLSVSDIFQLLDIEEELKSISLNDKDLKKLGHVINQKLARKKTEDPDFGSERSELLAYQYWNEERLKKQSTTADPGFELVKDMNAAPKLQKRLFRKSGLSKTGSVMAGVFKSIGSSVKKAAVKVVQFLAKIKNEMKETFRIVKEKLKAAIARAKAVFAKSKAAKRLIFMKEVVTTTYENLPEPIKDMIFDKATDLVLGSGGDISLGLDDIDFDPNSLEDDDDLAEQLEQEGLGLDDDSELDDLETEMNEFKEKEYEQGKISKQERDEDLFSEEEEAVIRGDTSRIIPKSQNKKKNHHKDCCCVVVNGDKKPLEDLNEDELESIDPVSLKLVEGLDDLGLSSDALDDDSSGLFNITMADFEPESLQITSDPVKDELDALEDMDYTEELSDEAFLNSLTKRSIQKRSNEKGCECSHRALMKREIAIGKRNKKLGRRQPPALTSALPPDATIAFLNQSGIRTDNLCTSANKKPDCVNLDGVRVGALAGLMSLKLICPLCPLHILSAGEASSNPFLKGWEFEIEPNDELNVFISESFSSFDGQAELFDQNKNRWSIETKDKNNLENFKWKVLVHL
ncbi:hypothetical protein Ciccas_004960 [Cichlidogyrus casuarinus]|uniref:Uncharacterized protein n=1 Tax=Cichlidogyrus casuarinus TaxID=1844966 RepID=A0ABD2QAW5_9PLAT